MPSQPTCLAGVDGQKGKLEAATTSYTRIGAKMEQPESKALSGC